MLWLGDGLLNDHTDGHVDNLARFVAPGVVACPIAWGENDPNAEVYDAVARDLLAMTDAEGRAIRVLRVPSPGRIEDEGEVIPASHMNFLIANGAVLMPAYGDPADAKAAEVMQAAFPDREIVQIDCRPIIWQNGSLHCLTMQLPAGLVRVGP